MQQDHGEKVKEEPQERYPARENQSLADELEDTSHLPDETSRTPRLAVFGGSFDPLHNAHLFLAGDLLRRKLADEVLFVPARRPPHKGGRILTPHEHRMAMVTRALEPFEAFSVSDIELVKAETSYTFDTMNLLSRVYPDHDLVFLMGLDSMAELHEWYKAPELVNRFNFLIYPRPGVEIPPYSRIVKHFGNRNARKLTDAVIDTPSLPIAATDIRRFAAEGQNLSGLVPESVLQYIKDHKLYQGA